jgi:hypothetical protein
MDFEDIFLPLGDNSSDSAVKRKATLLYNANDIIENGFDIIFDKDTTIHMRPFDKSGNMSRNGRITFVNEVYVKDLNERLNLGIDFSDMKVKLSKYYAYRGLYLSTAQRVEHKSFEITPETLVIVKNKRLDKKGNNIRNDYKRGALLATAKQGQNPDEWEFEKPEIKELETVDIPHDGVGLITEDYAEYINKKNAERAERKIKREEKFIAKHFKGIDPKDTPKVHEIYKKYFYTGVGLSVGGGITALTGLIITIAGFASMPVYGLDGMTVGFVGLFGVLYLGAALLGVSSVPFSMASRIKKIHTRLTGEKSFTPRVSTTGGFNGENKLEIALGYRF